jgi:regulator of cell morphogenesis and NO signaling
MQNTITDYSSLRMADLAIEYPAAVTVFNHYHLDFCCGGSMTLREACLKEGVDVDQVTEALLHQESASLPGTIRFDTWDLTLLSEFIIQHHHQYVRNSIPQLRELLNKVVDAHAQEYPVLQEIQQNFAELGAELMQHMVKEELILFPSIQQMEINTTQPAMKLDGPIHVMEEEHTYAGNLIKKIRSLTQNYAPPAAACPTWRVTYKRLQEFDNDLMQHIHIENNILFKRASELEHKTFA